MGWLYMQSLGGFSGPRQYLDDQFIYTRETEQATVLRSSLVKMRTYYAAVELLRPDRDREVVALVCLVRYNPRDREGYIFGYKDLDETMGRFGRVGRFAPGPGACARDPFLMSGLRGRGRPGRG